MSTNLFVLNYMRGSGGEFITSHIFNVKNTHNIESNRYRIDDDIIHAEFEITFCEWTNALCLGYKSIDDYIFYTKCNGNFKKYESYKLKFPGSFVYNFLKKYPYETSLKNLCLSYTLNMTDKNKFLLTHYKHSNKISLKQYFPQSKVVKICTKNVDLNYFRFLFIIKYLLSNSHLLIDEILEFTYNDMFFYVDCPFNNSCDDEFVIDAYDLYFKQNKKLELFLSDYLQQKILINFNTIEKYVQNNLNLLKQHMNYNLNNTLTERQAEELYVRFVEANALKSLPSRLNKK